MSDKIKSLRNINPAMFFKKIKQLGAKKGEEKGSLQIRDHVDNNLSPAESAERLAQKVSETNKKFPPLNIDNLPRRVQERLKSVEDDEIPELKEYEVYNAMKQHKQTSSSVPGDLPTKLRKEYAPFLATVACKIFNNINKTGMYPRKWVYEYVTPVPKGTDFPDSEDEVRPISIIPDLARDYNRWVVKWLEPYLKQRMDPGQFGGRKGMSISHLLIV